MFTAYEDRIEIVSLGTLPPGQTKEGFFAGVSIPVNRKLSEIFLQLHISEKSGRGVPGIVHEYGEEAFEFKDNAIVVTIPLNRLDLGIPPKIPPGYPQVAEERLNSIADRILDFCVEAKNRQEILSYLGMKDRKNFIFCINQLLEQGCLARTIPDKPSSRNQKYITIR